METIYYIETSVDDSPIALLKLMVDDSAEEVSELLWQNNEWVETDRIMDGLLNGGVILKQVSTADATMAFPDAFSQ